MNNNWIGKLSKRNEIILVLIIGFGYFIISSNIKYISKLFFCKNSIDSYDTLRFYHTTIIELILLSAILYVLSYRNFKFSELKMDISVKILLLGFLLFITNNVACISIIRVLKISAVDYYHVKFTASVISTISILIVNSFYEEFLLNGYIFNRFEGINTFFIIMLSAGIRASYHTYQGAQSVILIFATGIVFSFFYSRLKLLWPLVIAHGLTNLNSFFAINHQQ